MPSLPLDEQALIRLLPEVRNLARAAGRAILAHYDDQPTPIAKPDGSPVTQADFDADAVISPGLAALTPNIPVVSEESRTGDPGPIADGNFWLVDPLDGTRDFIARTGEFTVNIGLILGGRPVLGVMHVPIGNMTFAGTVPGGAVVARGDNADTPLRTRPTPAAGLTITVSRWRSRTEGLETYLSALKVHETVPRSSAVKFCDVAGGLADLYPCFGPSYEWDTAAGHAIVDAAGGKVTLPDGSPFLYGKPDFRNGNFVVHGTR